MGKILLLVACLCGLCFGQNVRPQCRDAEELLFGLLRKETWAKGYEFLISAVILGDKKIKDLETGSECHYTEAITCEFLDFYITYKCPDKYIDIFKEYQRLESMGSSNNGNAEQPLGTK